MIFQTIVIFFLNNFFIEFKYLFLNKIFDNNYKYIFFKFL